MRFLHLLGVFLFAILFVVIGESNVTGHPSANHNHVMTIPSLDALSQLSRKAVDSPTHQAITQWSDRLKHDSRDVDAWVNLGNALMQRAREIHDATYPGYAAFAYHRALEIESENTDALVGLSWVYGNRHEFDRSVECAYKAFALDPACYEALGLLGDAAVEMGDYDLAFIQYQKMLDIRPDFSSYTRSAHLLFLTGDTNNAISLLLKAIDLGSPYAENTAWCRAQLALIFWSHGAYGPAEQQLQLALNEAPNHFEALLMMGKIKTSRKDYEAAIEHYKKALAITPHYEALVILGDLYTLMGRQEEAKEQYALVEDLCKANKANGIEYDIQTARFYADHDMNLENALAQAKAVYEKQKSVSTADTLAWCYYKNGHYKEAQRIIQEALRLKTPDATILFHAGMINNELGALDTAQKYLNSALSLNPGFHPVLVPIAIDTLKELTQKRTPTVK